ncbi:hypothetical protein LWI28_024650 [Acer negundo]|uniref:Phorbol-ester/DAG-type domain-containing protein n=1 Tax=Acer negundo TaxID=4023 RepID=A0AAD5NHW9_ACENE|nr:hypothetical protein LWI28_024650 [Acer negundo]
MEETHPSHKNHKLKLGSSNRLYRCEGCQEIGVGAHYVCDKCNFVLHRDCMFNKPITHHHFYKNCTFEFFDKPFRRKWWGIERYCYGGGKPVKGFVYHCKDRDKDLHPCCLNLASKSEVLNVFELCSDGLLKKECLWYKLKVDDVKFKLRDKVLKKCFWCKRRRLEGSISGIRGWSYVSKCDKYHFHVNCASGMMLQGWKNESYSNNDYNDQTAPDSLALENLELPIQGRFRGNGGRSSGDKFIRIVKMFFKVFVGILLGDPFTITLTCLAELIR